jgi:hypothetical protein
MPFGCYVRAFAAKKKQPVQPLTSDKNSKKAVFISSRPSPQHRMCVVSASNPNMGAYKPVLITAGAEKYSLVAIQRI